jgi:hypothetical protein
MTVDELPDYLRHYWVEIRAQLVAGTYARNRFGVWKSRSRMDASVYSAFRRCWIVPSSKPLHKLFLCNANRIFTRKAMGFARSARRIRPCGSSWRTSKRWVVDLDVEAFFYRINHDRLVARRKRHVSDRALLRLVNRYRKAGVHVDGRTQATTMGVPQGGLLSPVLANVVPDELAWDLTRCGHRFTGRPMTATIWSEANVRVTG